MSEGTNPPRINLQSQEELVQAIKAQRAGKPEPAPKLAKPSLAAPNPLSIVAPSHPPRSGVASVAPQHDPARQLEYLVAFNSKSRPEHKRILLLTPEERSFFEGYIPKEAFSAISDLSILVSEAREDIPDRIDFFKTHSLDIVLRAGALVGYRPYLLDKEVPDFIQNAKRYTIDQIAQLDIFPLRKEMG